MLKKQIIPIVRAFQSALPRGERPLEQTDCLLRRHFNPRSREGNDGQRSRGLQ